MKMKRNKSSFEQKIESNKSLDDKNDNYIQ